MYILLATFLWYAFYNVLQSYKKSNAPIARILKDFFLLSGIAATFQGIFQLIEFTSSTKNERVLLFGDFFLDSALVFIIASIFILHLFIEEVFKTGIKKNLQKTRIVGIFSILGMIFMYISTFTNNSENLIHYAILFFISLYVYAVLMKVGFKLSKKIDDPISKKSSKLMAFTGILQIISYVAVIIYKVNSDFYFMRYITVIFLLAGYCTLYFGFIIPMKHRLYAFFGFVLQEDE